MAMMVLATAAASIQCQICLNMIIRLSQKSQISLPLVTYPAKKISKFKLLPKTIKFTQRESFLLNTIIFFTNKTFFQIYRKRSGHIFYISSKKLDSMANYDANPIRGLKRRARKGRCQKITTLAYTFESIMVYHSILIGGNCKITQ